MCIHFIKFKFTKTLKLEPYLTSLILVRDMIDICVRRISGADRNCSTL